MKLKPLPLLGSLIFLITAILFFDSFSRSLELQEIRVTDSNKTSKIAFVTKDITLYFNRTNYSDIEPFLLDIQEASKMSKVYLQTSDTDLLFFNSDGFELIIPLDSFDFYDSKKKLTGISIIKVKS